MSDIRVIKFGGSLLNWDQAIDQFYSWLQLQKNAHNVVIAGGGEIVDVIRNWDSQLGLGEEASHHLALSGMRTTSHLLRERIPKAGFVSDFEKLKEVFDEISEARQAITLFDCSDWIARQKSLPQTWDFTSDSIAAVVANGLRAFELVLLKSTIKTDKSHTKKSDDGIVDPLLAGLIATTTTRIVNLRSSKFVEINLAAN